jgi:hypothetical protein
MNWRRLLAWLRLRERPISAGVALLSLIVALLSSLAALVQAGLLVGQLWTPYRTALYVRQLEAAGDYYAAAHEQWAAIIDLNQQCQERVRAGLNSEEDFWKLSERFRTGATRLHGAYSATIASFPGALHHDAAIVWNRNERLMEQVVSPATSCSRFTELYLEQGAYDRADDMNNRARALVDDMRLLLRVERWSRNDIERERARSARIKQVREKFFDFAR